MRHSVDSWARDMHRDLIRSLDLEFSIGPENGKSLADPATGKGRPFFPPCTASVQLSLNRPLLQGSP
jgi:hypothetical protein